MLSLSTEKCSLINKRVDMHHGAVHKSSEKEGERSGERQRRRWTLSLFCASTMCKCMYMCVGVRNIFLNQGELVSK